MKKQLGIFAIAALLTTITFLVVKKFIKNNLKEAKRLYKLKKYKESLEKYKGLEQTQEVLNGIAMCLIKLKQYEEALASLNESLKINMHENALKWRIKVYKKLGNKKMALSDSLIDKPLISLQDIVEKETINFVVQHNLPPSNINFLEFFGSFQGVLKEDKLSICIKEKNWEKLNQMDEEEGNELLTLRVVKSSLLYLKDLFKEAVDTLSSPSNPLEFLLKEYFSFYAFQKIPNIDFYAKDTKNNATLIYFTNKLSKIINQNEEDLISTNCNLRRAKEALKVKNYTLVNSLIPLLDKEDPNSLLFRAEYAFALRDFNSSFLILKMVIKKDPTHFKAYFMLGEILSLRYPKEKVRIWKEVLGKASRVREVRIVMYILVTLECSVR